MSVVQGKPLNMDLLLKVIADCLKAIPGQPTPGVDLGETSVRTIA